MKATLGALLLTVLASACTGAPLDAGSTASATSPTPLAPPTTLATIDALIDGFAMDATNLYFTAEDGTLYALAKTGASAPVNLAPAATPGSAYTGGLTVDDASLYWTALGDGVSSGVVLTVAKSGGDPTALAKGQGRPTGIAVDGTNVYWSNQGPPPPATAMTNTGMPQPAIMTVPKGGGTATVLVTNPVAPDARRDRRRLARVDVDKARPEDGRGEHHDCVGSHPLGELEPRRVGRDALLGRESRRVVARVRAPPRW